MISSKAESVAASGSWNPLRLSGTTVPVPVLLTAKLIAVSLLLTNYVQALGLDVPVHAAVFRRTFQAVFVLSALAIVFNRWVRLSCLLLGGSILPGLFSSRAILLFYALAAVPLAFLRWPKKPLEVIYDGDCGFCDWTRRWIGRVDFDGAFAWWPFQSGHGDAYGISRERASGRLQLVTASGAVLEGFHAVRRMLVYLSVTWLALFAFTAVAPATLRWILVCAALFFFSPLANPAGVRVYDWVARNRHRIFPAVCGLPAPEELKKQ